MFSLFSDWTYILRCLWVQCKLLLERDSFQSAAVLCSRQIAVHVHLYAVHIAGVLASRGALSQLYAYEIHVFLHCPASNALIAVVTMRLGLEALQSHNIVLFQTLDQPHGITSLLICI